MASSPTELARQALTPEHGHVQSDLERVGVVEARVEMRVARVNAAARVRSVRLRRARLLRRGGVAFLPRRAHGDRDDGCKNAINAPVVSALHWAVCAPQQWHSSAAETMKSM